MIPDTFTLSSSECPRTSKPPLASTNPVNVEIPVTERFCPTVKSVEMSADALISRSLPNVDTPTNSEYP
jgi:hypothetical protein